MTFIKLKKMNNNINLIKCLINKILQIITISNYIHQKSFYNLRDLEQTQVQSEQKRKENQKRQLNELFIYLSILIGLIIIILGGYNIYKRYVEKQALREINRENDNYNIQHSISAASQEERNVYSFNAKVYNNKYKASEIESYNEHNNSFDFNHEERMEKIRKKYGNKMLIKILIKQQIDNVIYDKNLGVEYGDNCTICVNNFIDNMEIYRTPCEHIFHKDCFNKYLKKINKKNKLTCPNCNQNLLINKKFLKLRQEAQKIKIKDYKDKENVLNINNLETEKKEIMNENISTIDADKNINNIINNIIENENTNSKEDVLEPIFIVKKRKIEIPQIIKELAQKDKIKLNSPNSDENNEMNINKKESDEIYINNMDNDNKKEHIYVNAESRIDIENNKINADNLYNFNLNNKKKKLGSNRINVSNFENRFNNKRLISKEFNSSRELNEIRFNNTAESNK